MTNGHKLELRNNKWDASLRWHDSLIGPHGINACWLSLNKLAKKTVMPAKAGIPFAFVPFSYSVNMSAEPCP